MSDTNTDPSSAETTAPAGRPQDRRPQDRRAQARRPDDAKAVEVFFDGACPVCRREIALYQGVAEDGVAWRDVGAATPADDDAAAIARTGLDQRALLKRFHVRRADGSIASGAAAFFALWRSIPRLAWAGRLLDRQPFIALGEVAYRAFLAIRPLWRRER